MFLQERLDHTFKRLKAQTANALTLINLSLGGFAVIFILNDTLHMSLIFIFLAALSDRYDGMTARRLNIVSDLGKQLDSMADLVSFGIAPAFLLYQAVLNDFGAPGAFFTVLYIAMGALRLAKFNLQENTGYFSGLPIPAAGILITISYLLINVLPGFVFMFLILVLALLMVSPFKLKKI
ncbi:CDP-diacylglycerol--serine O-phosphatidyltransferase [Bacillus marinisedimentorum]|uniref:CDP-diacylglycerol--serine O-phosphatidyltransferase n=1 Tax=Bacillus marinisedimentorum TaxID=1821260 RepID=UPI0008722099|nr:CDP-diacylglycerol--serine O-phosphatidyltransferase [Bacillus marinisedimentorum]